MRATVTSTQRHRQMKDAIGRPFIAQVWEGVTDAGVPFTAYIAIAQVHKDADNSKFVADLTESVPPRPETQRAIDMRFVCRCGADVKRFGCDPLEARLCLNCIYASDRFSRPAHTDGHTEPGVAG